MNLIDAAKHLVRDSIPNSGLFLKLPNMTTQFFIPLEIVKSDKWELVISADAVTTPEQIEQVVDFMRGMPH